VEGSAATSGEPVGALGHFQWEGRNNEGSWTVGPVGKGRRDLVQKSGEAGAPFTSHFPKR